MKLLYILVPHLPEKASPVPLMSALGVHSKDIGRTQNLIVIERLPGRK